MLEKFVVYLTNHLYARLILSGVVVAVPVSITASSVGSACMNAFTGAGFLRVATGGFITIMASVFLCGVPVLYVLERWLIRGRASSSWKWQAARFLTFAIAGIPEGFAVIVAYNFGMAAIPILDVNAIFIGSIASLVLVATLYSLVEQALSVFQKREAHLTKQIRELRIEIDQARQEQEVSAIVDNDFFRDLQTKADELRHPDTGLSKAGGTPG